MDAAAFEQVYGDFQEFHAYFAGLFGRRETRERSGHYLQALLVQPGELSLIRVIRPGIFTDIRPPWRG